MSQVKDRNKKILLAPLVAIVLYPHSQNCDATYISRVSCVHLITTNYCPLKLCTPDRLSLTKRAWSGDSGPLWFLSGTP